MFATRVENRFYFCPGHWPSGVLFFPSGQFPAGKKTPIFHPRGEITIQVQDSPILAIYILALCPFFLLDAGSLEFSSLLGFMMAFMLYKFFKFFLEENQCLFLGDTDICMYPLGYLIGVPFGVTFK